MELQPMFQEKMPFLEIYTTAEHWDFQETSI